MKPDKTTIAVSGSTGLIGSSLVRALRADGIRVLSLTRHPNGSSDEIHFSARDGVREPSRLEGVDAIVHLAGAPIARRWSDERKREIRDSRVQTTLALARAVATLERKPRAVLSGSAIGYYGDRGDELLNENSPHGSGFLAEVTEEWEAATAPMQGMTRIVHLRTGVVLSRHGGALEKLLPPFRLGAGGPIGNGRQWMSWISLHDHVRAMRHLLATASAEGAVNLVAPSPARNEDFSNALGRALHRPSVLRVPAFAVGVMFGEMGRETVLVSQRAVPSVLIRSGFTFDDQTLDQAFARELAAS